MKKDTHGTNHKGWIGVDLDGTLAFYDGWKGPEHIGLPIPLMERRVDGWLTEGKDVRILTARVTPDKPDAIRCREAIEKWLQLHFDRVLPITHAKDPAMLELWDDRAVQVVPNSGCRADSIIERCWAALSRFLCWIGCHDWRHGPGSLCPLCGQPDTLFDP